MVCSTQQNPRIAFTSCTVTVDWQDRRTYALASMVYNPDLLVEDWWPDWESSHHQVVTLLCQGKARFTVLYPHPTSPRGKLEGQAPVFTCIHLFHSLARPLSPPSWSSSLLFLLHLLTATPFLLTLWLLGHVISAGPLYGWLGQPTAMMLGCAQVS